MDNSPKPSTYIKDVLTREMAAAQGDLGALLDERIDVMTDEAIAKMVGVNQAYVFRIRKAIGAEKCLRRANNIIRATRIRLRSEIEACREAEENSSMRAAKSGAWGFLIGAGAGVLICVCYYAMFVA